MESEHSKANIPYAIVPIDVDENTFLAYKIVHAWEGNPESDTATLVNCREGEYSDTQPEDEYSPLPEITVAPEHKLVQNDIVARMAIDTLPEFDIGIAEGYYERIRMSTATTEFSAKVTVWEYELQNGKWIIVDEDEYTLTYRLRYRFHWNENCHDQGGT